METIEQEKIFHQDSNVTVSQARFIANGKTYAMRNISSVSNHKIEVSRTWPILLLIIGGVLSIPDSSRIPGIVLVILALIWLFS